MGSQVHWAAGLPPTRREKLQNNGSVIPAGQGFGSAAARWAKLSSSSYSRSWGQVKGLNPSWRAKVREPVADSKKKIQMGYVGEQMARSSYLLGQSKPFQEPSPISIEKLNYFFSALNIYASGPALTMSFLPSVFQGRHSRDGQIEHLPCFSGFCG